MSINISDEKQQYAVTAMAIGMLIIEYVMAYNTCEAKEIFLMQYKNIEPTSISITRSIDDAQIEYFVRMLLAA